MFVKYRVSDGEILYAGSTKENIHYEQGEAVAEYKGKGKIVSPYPLKAFKFVDGEFVEKSQEEKEQYLYAEKRRAEYPSTGDQLDAIWKILSAIQPVGAAPEALDVLSEIETIKNKYPKPEKGA